MSRRSGCCPPPPGRQPWTRTAWRKKTSTSRRSPTCSAGPPVAGRAAADRAPDQAVTPGRARNLTAFERATGWRYSIIVTNIPVRGIGGVPGSHHAQFIDVLHRQHAVVEDGVRTAKSMGLRNLPSKTWVVNCGWVLGRPASPPTWLPGAGCSACMTRTISKTPSRTSAALPVAQPARPAGPPRPRPGAEDQPDLALEGRLPGLLATAVCPARTRLTKPPVPATGKGGRPAQSEPVPSRAHRAAPPPASQLPPPKTGTTRSVTDLAGTLNHRG